MSGFFWELHLGKYFSAKIIEPGIEGECLWEKGPKSTNSKKSNRTFSHRGLLKPLEKWCLSETRYDELSESFVRSKIHQIRRSYVDLKNSPGGAPGGLCNDLVFLASPLKGLLSLFRQSPLGQPRLTTP